MSFFGIPIIIPFDSFVENLRVFSENLTYNNYLTTFLNSDMVIPLYYFMNFVYIIFFFFGIIPLFYKITIFFKNNILK